MKVYQIVQLQRETSGHGESADIAVLASKDAYSVNPYPLYNNILEAEARIKEDDIYGASIMELFLI